MSHTIPMNPAEHDEHRRRFTLDCEGNRGVLDYSLSGGVMTITHTAVPPPIAGRGIAAELMKTALAAARASGWRVTPACSYAAAYLARHPDEAGQAVSVQHREALLDEALDESFPASDPPSVGQVD
jgi:predicted GNAT family acetyltransferase